MSPSLLKKDCPFCGQSKDMYIGVYCRMEDVERPYFVQCQSCGGKTGYYRTQEGAVNAWNGEFDYTKITEEAF